MSEQQVTSNQSPYPSEVIDLPSKGYFYPEGSPLKSGQIDIKYMTAREEDILTSTNLIQKGIVLDKLMDSLIVTKGVKSSDLLIGDLNAVMVATRILGYGKDYNIETQCPKCGTTIEQTVDLSQLQTINEPTSVTSTPLTVTLPLSKSTVTLKLLTRGDELAIDKEVKALKKANGDIDSEATTRLRTMITSVDGDTSKTKIWSFVDTLLVRDVRYLREEYRKHIPDINFDIAVSCECLDEPIMTRLPIGANFFWPDVRI